MCSVGCRLRVNGRKAGAQGFRGLPQKRMAVEHLAFMVGSGRRRKEVYLLSCEEKLLLPSTSLRCTWKSSETKSSAHFDLT